MRKFIPGLRRKSGEKGDSGFVLPVDGASDSAAGASQKAAEKYKMEENSGDSSAAPMEFSDGSGSESDSDDYGVEDVHDFGDELDAAPVASNSDDDSSDYSESSLHDALDDFEMEGTLL